MNLHDYDHIIVSTSGGKDSQAMEDKIYYMAIAQDYPISNITAAHANLGRAEWQGTKDLAEAQAKAYGFKFVAVTRPQGDILTHVEEKGLWPGPTTRWCTSDHKRGQINKVFTQLSRDLDSDIKVLHCMGLRAEESPKRKKTPNFQFHTRYSTEMRKDGTRARHVDEWLPIQTWTLEDVWKTIENSQVPYHYAYDLGMSRLSCVFCIFAPRPELLIAGEHNRPLLDEHVRIERKINHTFRHEFKIESIRDALDAGEHGEAETDEAGRSCGAWNM